MSMDQPPYSMDDGLDVEDFDELESLDEESSANRRQFMRLLIVFGSLLGVAVIALVFIVLTRNGEKSDIELTNEAVLATNAAVEQAIIATETADVAIATQKAATATGVAIAQASAATETAEAVTAAALATEAARPTATDTPTPTPVVPPAETSESGEEGEGEGVDEGEDGATREPSGTAVAQVSVTSAPATRTLTPRPTQGASATPETGVGGLGALLIAGVLVFVVVAARRLRLST